MRWAALALLLGGCAAGPVHDWGDYDAALVAYRRSPAKEPLYIHALERAIADGEKFGTLAPGLKAELGFMRLRNGDREGAIALFEAEAAAFEASRPLMRRMIAAARPASDSAP